MKQEDDIAAGGTRELGIDGDGDIAAAAAASPVVTAGNTISTADTADTADTAAAAATTTATAAAATTTAATTTVAPAVVGASAGPSPVSASHTHTLEAALALDPSAPRQLATQEHQQQHHHHHHHHHHDQELQHELQHPQHPQQQEQLELQQHHQQHQEQGPPTEAVHAPPPATAHGDHVATGAVALATTNAAKKNPTPFVCEVVGCNKAFGKKFNLKAHKRVHTGEEPFKCSFPTCEKMFKWKSSLTFHEGLHLNQPDDEPSLPMQSLPVPVVQGHTDQLPQPVQEQGPTDSVEDIPADPTRIATNDIVETAHFPQDDAVNGEPTPKKQKV